VTKRLKAGEKYAPTKDCTMCGVLGEMCMGCAMRWQEKRIDDEQKLLRDLVLELRGRSKGCCNVPMTRLLARYDRIQNRRPKVLVTPRATNVTKGK
jgi:hypothetical protein